MPLFSVLSNKAKELLLSEHPFPETINSFGHSAGSEGSVVRIVDFWDANKGHDGEYAELHWYIYQCNSAYSLKRLLVYRTSAWPLGSWVYIPTIQAARKDLSCKKNVLFFLTEEGAETMGKTIDEQLVSRIYGNGRGWAFSQADFADLGSRPAIDLTLYRREKEGLIRRVIRGIYDYPRYSKVLEKTVSPDINQVAHALARKFGWRIQPDGATAQNLLGLSTQVPASILYLSDGPNRFYKVGETVLTFEHAALKEAGFKLPESRLVVQALKAYGEDRITPKIIASIRKKIDPALRQRILLDTKTSTGWVYAAIQEIAKEQPHG